MAGNYENKKYDVDLVFCIDATGSMKPWLDKVKKNAENLYDDLCAKMKAEHRDIARMRVRLIAFRDYAAAANEDKKNNILPMLTTDFFNLPEERKEFSDCLASIQPIGGGDVPEDGLEALAFAIKNTKWAEPRAGILRRQIIVVWTDAGTHELGFGRSAPDYPPSMAKDFNELTRWWGYSPDEAAQQQIDGSYMDFVSKRLLIFAPEEEWWTTVSGNWCNAIHVPTVTGDGMTEVAYDHIISLLTQTITSNAVVQ